LTDRKAERRAEQRRKKRMDGFAVWVTGLPGPGKTALAREIERLLSQRGRICEILEAMR